MRWLGSSKRKRIPWHVEAKDVPRTVLADLDAHERMSRYNQRMARAAESVILVVSASVPVAAALEAPAAVLGVLGGLVTVLAAMSTQYRWRENWTRHSQVVVNIHREMVKFDHGQHPYERSTEGGQRRANLAINVENLVHADAGTWADRERRESRNVEAPTDGADLRSEAPT
jgi:Protein of unknown function (DUF4231)